MAVSTQFSGYVRRYDGSNLLIERRLSVSRTVDEGNFGRIQISPGSTDVDIMPRGLTKATSDIIGAGVLYLNGSLNGVSVSNRNATGIVNLYYDIKGK